ncbi:uncharacterized protein LOC119569913, partial [Penaeus monodon]|uniref:uncharacterized protein LOC119569913 n=1 Tax=Penaeus monodon TaxID=6687 RepID=UPI0018A7646E
RTADTAYLTHVGHFGFLVSPMGLRNSPLTFSPLMALLLQGLINDQVLVYLDNILVCSPSTKDHEARLRSFSATFGCMFLLLLVFGMCYARAYRMHTKEDRIGSKAIERASLCPPYHGPILVHHNVHKH